ncbi:hypothetical protein F5B20DRAFT_565758 [Whalleya microplaca]|nr:hypothetical protein F5B20DRAFT_565758 [Whalleya microplaca]
MPKVDLATHPSIGPARQRQHSLLGLPPEIRNLIYTFLLSNTMHIYAPSKRRSRSRWPATPLSLACTCHVLYMEFAPLYYSTTKYVTERNQGHSVALWLEVVGCWAGTAIKMVQFPWIPRCCIVGYKTVRVLEGGMLSGEPEKWTVAIKRQREKQKKGLENASEQKGGKKKRRTNRRHRAKITKRKMSSDTGNNMREKLAERAFQGRLVRQDGVWVRNV